MIMQGDDKDDDHSVKTDKIEFEICINFVRDSVTDFIGGVAIICCTYANDQHQKEMQSKSKQQDRNLIFRRDI